MRFEMFALGYRNHKSCKILPKFLPTLHFLQESYKFVQESQILQSCYNVEHFLQDSDNIFAKIAFLRQKFLQKLQCVISTKNSFKTVTFVQFCVFLPKSIKRDQVYQTLSRPQRCDGSGVQL